MVASLEQLDALIATHQNEASDGIIQVAPSRLNRGQGTEKYFHILKIDLANSTFLMGRHQATYLRLAHTFLSTVDQITKFYGADEDQTEYAGDSVLAYFPDSVSAEHVLLAACYAKVAVERIASLQTDVALQRLNCRVVLHYAPLIVARIGPRADSHLNTIGLPIHKVAKLEKEVNVGIGRATIDFYNLIQKANRQFLTGVYTERQVLAPSPVVPDFGLSIPSSVQLARILMPEQFSAPAPLYQTERTLIGYDINWILLKSVLNL